MLDISRLLLTGVTAARQWQKCCRMFQFFSNIIQFLTADSGDSGKSQHNTYARTRARARYFLTSILIIIKSTSFTTVSSEIITISPMSFTTVSIIHHCQAMEGGYV